MRSLTAAASLCVAFLTLAAAPAPGSIDWAYPDGRGKPPAGGWDRQAALSVPGGAARFVEADLHDFFKAVDWRPRSHPPMPAVVAVGRAPDLYACGFCHLPAGEGRPENVALAGMPRDYMVRQVKAFASGARTSAVHGWFPSASMSGVGRAVTPSELDAAADYFSRLSFTSRVKVVETARLPTPKAANFLFVPGTGKAVEPLGDRIVEAPSSMESFERRDPRVQFTAYVPVGSLQRGAALAGGRGGVQACASCHGAGLKGGGLGPPLAGRSPSYLFRQLYGFQSGARSDPDAAPMKGVVAHMPVPDMIALAAYAGAQKP
jgi:cytochrome c553